MYVNILVFRMSFLASELYDDSCIRKTVPQYMFDLPKSKLGIYRKAAVITDAEPCAEIGRWVHNYQFTFKLCSV